MKLKKAVYIMAALVLALVLASCGADGEEKAVNEFRELMKQEQDILSQNSVLWEKVFMAADKGMTLQEDGKNYGDFLLNEVVPAPAVPLAAAEYGEGDGAQRQQIGAYDEIPEIEEGASLRKGLEAGKRRKAQRGRK